MVGKDISELLNSLRGLSLRDEEVIVQDKDLVKRFRFISKTHYSFG